jgi:8-oxo-dGTP pyrophosphatase MutT (NUDIX family)
MRRVKSCGFLVVRRHPTWAFLLLRHRHRFDLPKGHLESGETELACAWRELREETGLTEADVQQEEGFRFVTHFYPRYHRFGGMRVEKQVVIFLGWLEQPREVVLSEHPAYEWVPWQPPHRLQEGLIDEVLAAAWSHLQATGVVQTLEEGVSQ